MNPIKELLAVLAGHLAAWWGVVTGRVDPDAPTGWPVGKGALDGH